MKSRPLDILSTMLIIVVIGQLFYQVLPKQPEPVKITRLVYDTLGITDTLAITSLGDTIFDHLIDLSIEK